MKNKALIVLTIIAALSTWSLYSQSAPSATGSFIDHISLTPVGVVKTANLSGPSQWGAGLDVGVAVNPFVSIHVVNIDFEGRDSWRGLLVDETDILVKAKIARFSTESFSIYGIGGANRDWNTQDWGFSAGVGAELAFNKHFSLIADYSIRAWFNHPKDSLARAGINFSF